MWLNAPEPLSVVLSVSRRSSVAASTGLEKRLPWPYWEWYSRDQRGFSGLLDGLADREPQVVEGPRRARGVAPHQSVRAVRSLLASRSGSRAGRNRRP